MKRVILICCLIILFSFQISAVAIANNIPIQIQTTDAAGNIVTGTFRFTINISNSDTCSPVLYSDNKSLTTDARGIVSYNLEDVDLSFDEQYWFCYYRDGTLKETLKMGRLPYTFTAKNVTLSGVEIDKNLDMGSYNVTANYSFFTYLGSLVNRITNIFATDIDVTGDVNASGTINAGSFVGVGSGITNVIASDLGDIGCAADKYLQWDGGNWICANMPSSGSNVYVNLIPAGTVAAFNRSTCPDGWTPANGSGGTPDLRGIFVRGAGVSGSYTMANGTAFSATFGEYQNDSFQGHYHSAYNTATTGGGASRDGANEYGGGTATTPVTAGTAYGTPRYGGETRPASFGLIYCVKEVDSSPETDNLFDTTANLVYVKNTSHDLGVGTANPNSKLEVNGTFSVKNGTGGQGLYQDSTGNVGIGTTTPQNTLNVVGDVNVTGFIYGDGSQLTNLSGGGTPANTISAFYQATCPTGWILADGTSGTPDLRGIFVRGAGTNSVINYANGTSMSATYGTYQNDSFQGHRFSPISGQQFVHYSTSGQSWTMGAGAYFERSATTGDPVTNTIHGTPRTGAETRPASFGLIYCMKTTEDSATSNTIWGESGDDIVPNNSSKNVHLSQNLTITGSLILSNNTMNETFIMITTAEAYSGTANDDYEYAYCPTGYTIIFCSMSSRRTRDPNANADWHQSWVGISGNGCYARAYALNGIATTIASGLCVRSY